MKERIFFVFIFILITVHSYSQLQLSDVRDMAMGNSTVASVPISGIPKNLSIIKDRNESFISLSASNKYLIKDLSPLFISAQKTLKDNISLVAGIGRMGNNHFSEQFFETGIAKKLGRIFSAGIKFQYHQWLLNEQRYENSSVIIPEIDLYAEPLKDFSFGVIIRNPVRVRMSTIEKKKLPAMIDPGISYKVSDKLILAISTIQLSDRPISCQAGVEYKFHPRLSLRFGWHTDPVCESYGFELMLSKLKLDLSLQTHPFLGNSTSLALTFPL